MSGTPWGHRFPSPLVWARRTGSTAASPPLLLTIILIGGLLLRLYSITFGLPDLHTVDETIVVNFVGGLLARGELNPHWFGWPGTTLMYMLCGLYAGIFLGGRAVGLIKDRHQFQALFYQDPTLFYLSGRVMITLVGVASIYLAYRIARRLCNRPIALAAAALLAVSPLHVAYSREIRTDVVLGFLFLVAFWFCLDVLERRAWSGYAVAGLVTGLAIATKYPGAIMGMLIVTAHVLAGPQRSVHVPKLLLSGAATVVGLVVGSPYLLIEWRAVLAHLADENRSRHLSATGEGFLGNVVWYIQNPFLDALSIGGLLLVALGLALCLASRQRDRWLLAAFPVMFTLALASLNLRWSRWMVPPVPFLCILAAFAAYWLVTTLGRHWPRGRGVAGILLVLIVGIPLLRADILQGRERSASETRTVARAWMLQHIPPGSRVLVEQNTPELPKHRYVVLQIPDEDGDIVHLDTASVRSATVRPKGLIGHLKNLDALRRANVEYVVLSNRYDRFLAEQERYADYAEIVRTYEAVMNRGTKMYEARAVSGVNRGPTIRIYRLQ